MKKFLARYHERITAVLSGFDRVVFRGTLCQLSHLSGLHSYLSHRKVLLKDFVSFTKSITAKIRATVEQWGESLGRPVEYLPSSRVSKEDFAKSRLEESGTSNGLICLLSCVEPCQSFDIHRSREKKLLELRVAERKCLHYYAYFDDDELGLLHVRLQTWFPLSARICINGREYLTKQMQKAGLGYEKADNSFRFLEDPQKAQQLMDQLLHTNWRQLLDSLLFRLHQSHGEIFGNDSMDYYWSVHQSEWATDVLFDSPSSLAEIYPQLTRFAMLHLQSTDVLRFLGRRRPSRFQGEASSDYKHRSEGVRVKHRVNSNSIKLYDKFGNILRTETTINDPADFKVFRAPEGKPEVEASWRRLRKGVADLHRLTHISQKANERYLDALAEVDTDERLAQLIKPLTRRTQLKGHPARALNPFGQDAEVLQAIARGDFILNGFRNSELLALLFPPPADDQERRRLAGRVSRLLRLLRAHKLIYRVQHTHRYHLTALARRALPALTAAREASVKRLLEAA